MSPSLNHQEPLAESVDCHSVLQLRAFLARQHTQRARAEGVEPEVIVVDDMSTDDSAAVAQRFADEFRESLFSAINRTVVMSSASTTDMPRRRASSSFALTRTIC